MKYTKFSEGRGVIKFSHMGEEFLGISIIFIGCLLLAGSSYFFANAPQLSGENYFFLVKVFPILIVASVIVVLFGLYIRSNQTKIIFNKENIVIKKNFFVPALKFLLGESLVVRIEKRDTGVKEKTVRTWLVSLADSAQEIPVFESNLYSIELHNIAEDAAKILNCPLLDLTGEAEVKISSSDFDIPFIARVKKYPHLMEEIPADAGPGFVSFKDIDGKRLYSWKFSLVKVLFTSVTFAMLSIIVSFMRFGLAQSIYDTAVYTGNYAYYFIIGALFIIVLFISLGYKAVLALDRENISISRYFLGIKTGHTLIPWNEVEEIRVSHEKDIASLRIISDRQEIICGSLIDDIGEFRHASSLASDIKKWVLANA
ncbi:MAG: hypothetical protein M1536_00300 [Firmicutes bacterium]|nr:hypothetical protein [Bacillota bacterium]